MIYTYTWKILNLITQKNVNNLQNVVVQCAWSVCGTCVEKTGEMDQLSWEHHIGGLETLPQPQPENFIEYAKLTEDQILQWLWNGVIDKNKIEQELRQKIDESKSPSVGESPLPWAA